MASDVNGGLAHAWLTFKKLRNAKNEKTTTENITQKSCLLQNREKNENGSFCVFL